MFSSPVGQKDTQNPTPNNGAKKQNKNFSDNKCVSQKKHRILEKLTRPKISKNSETNPIKKHV
jgi:hypothetical protein